MSYTTEIRVPCHCGNIELTLFTNKTVDELPRRRCLCSFCVAHGNVYTSDNEGELHIRISDEEQATRYRNPDSVSHDGMSFLVCKSCGVVTCAISEVEGVQRAVVSVAAGTTPPMKLEKVTELDVADESLPDRIERWKRSWVGRVSFGN